LKQVENPDHTAGPTGRPTQAVEQVAVNTAVRAPERKYAAPSLRDAASTRGRGGASGASAARVSRGMRQADRRPGRGEAGRHGSSRGPQSDALRGSTKQGDSYRPEIAVSPARARHPPGVDGMR